MKKIFLISLIIFSNPVIGKEVGIFDCSSKVGLGLDLLDNIYSYKDQGIQENFKLKLNPKDINLVKKAWFEDYKPVHLKHASRCSNCSRFYWEIEKFFSENKIKSKDISGWILFENFWGKLVN